jgi:hypothetical protein
LKLDPGLRLAGVGVTKKKNQSIDKTLDQDIRDQRL